MSRRIRYPKKRSADEEVQAYPAPQERQAIIQRRDDLLEQLIFLFASGAPPNDPRMTQLIMKYGPKEVNRVIEVFQKTVARQDFLVDEPMLYRDYRYAFARFGGRRRFLNKPEYEDLVYQHGLLLGKRKFGSFISKKPSRREEELKDLLLLGYMYWEDITPPDVPPRPPYFTAPVPQDYPDPALELLNWGWDLDAQRITRQARDRDRWIAVIPDLARMVYDEGLLKGWPSEAASWAPYHGLHLLGALRAHEYAASLIALAGRENDWLSDRLPSVWAQMGVEAEGALWEILDRADYQPDRRGLAIAGLRTLAKTHPGRRPVIIQGLIERLNISPPMDATVNGFIVFVLNKMEAVEARDAIASAFKKGIVDPKIMHREDVTL